MTDAFSSPQRENVPSGSSGIMQIPSSLVYEPCHLCDGCIPQPTPIQIYFPGDEHGPDDYRLHMIVYRHPGGNAAYTAGFQNAQGEWQRIFHPGFKGYGVGKPGTQNLWNTISYEGGVLKIDNTEITVKTLGKKIPKFMIPEIPYIEVPPETMIGKGLPRDQYWYYKTGIGVVASSKKFPSFSQPAKILNTRGKFVNLVIDKKEIVDVCVPNICGGTIFMYAGIGYIFVPYPQKEGDARSKAQNYGDEIIGTLTASSAA